MPKSQQPFSTILIPESVLQQAKEDEKVADLFDHYFPNSVQQHAHLLGGGVEGDVYEFGKDKVIKYATTYIDKKHSPNLSQAHIDIRDIIDGIQAAVHSGAACVAQVFDFQVVGKFKVTVKNRTNPTPYFAYYIISEKLLPPTWGHCEDINIGDVDPDMPDYLHGYNIIDGALMYQNDACLAAIKKSDKSLYQQVKQFLHCTNGLSFNFSDCHSGNVMQNEEGVLKIVDFGTLEF